MASRALMRWESGLVFEDEVGTVLVRLSLVASRRVDPKLIKRTFQDMNDGRLGEDASKDRTRSLEIADAVPVQKQGRSLMQIVTLLDQMAEDVCKVVVDKETEAAIDTLESKIEIIDYACRKAGQETLDNESYVLLRKLSKILEYLSEGDALQQDENGSPYIFLRQNKETHKSHPSSHIRTQGQVSGQEMLCRTTHASGTPPHPGPVVSHRFPQAGDIQNKYTCNQSLPT